MPHLELFRFGEAQNKETLGGLRVVDGNEVLFECCALELPWRDNQNNVSRIPDGTYVVEKLGQSPAFQYEHPWIHDEGSRYAAGDRGGIKIHVANFARQLEGCVAVGKEFRDLDGDGLLDVTDSEETLEGLLDAMPDKTTIEITSVPDESASPVPLGDLETTIAPIDLHTTPEVDG